MRLFSWNVNGVRAIEKKGFLDWVDNTSPDILCIQETKANFDQLPESLQNIHGYHGYWHSALSHIGHLKPNLLVILNEQVQSGNNVVVAGDWNTAHFPIDLANPKANEKNSGFMPVERAQLDEYVENGYVATFRLFHDEPERYSWWTYRFGARQRNIGWRIDYFFVNEGFVESVVDADIHEDVMGSDHCPVSIELVDNF